MSINVIDIKDCKKKLVSSNYNFFAGLFVCTR